VWSEYGNGLPEFNHKLIQRFVLLALGYALSGSASETIGVQLVDECKWEGVVCSTTNGESFDKVEEIRLSYSDLTGKIPGVIVLLQHLKVLDVAGNKLHGRIPESLYRIEGLKELYLYDNQLTGTLSSKISNWQDMTRLHLSHNKFSGTIPTEFKSGDKSRPLEYLNLYSNQFSGTIPNSLRFRNVVIADFGRNDFTGTLPEDFGLWAEVRALYMDHNKFTGTVPSTFPGMGNGRLEALTLNHNLLTGYVPDDWVLKNKLLQITLQENAFSGVGYDTCKQSVFNGGEMVEYKADCDICYCDPFCERKCEMEI